MRFGAVKWGVWGVSSLLGAFSCSGTELHEVGDLSSSGNGGSSVGGAPSSGGTLGGRAGAESSGGRVAQGGVAGTVAGGGAAGIPPEIVAGAGGEAGQPDNGALVCPGCIVVATGQDIRGVAANDQKVFWVDYGTSDKLGNYNGDGRLLVRDLDGGPTTVVADSLAGPESITLSANYAYIFIDKRDEAGKPLGVVRLPLAGGPVQPLQALSDATRFSYQIFASTVEYEYWTWGGAVYRVAQADNAQVEPFVSRQAGPLFADDTLLYFNDFAAVGAWTVPLSGGEPSQLTPARNSLLQLQGDYLYGIEEPYTAGDAGPFLTRMAKTGGIWKRLTAIGGLSQFAVDGDNYLTDEPTDTKRQILRRTFGATPTSVVLASESVQPNSSWAWNGWSLSRIGLFFADANGLYVTPTSAP